MCWTRTPPLSRTERAARLYAGAEVLVKTVDSTLRGHVAAELRAAWAGSRKRAVILAPAFPAEGRVTVAGVQYVRGVPVHESDYARDPAHPVRCSDLATLFPEAVLAQPDGAAKLPELVDNGNLIVYSAAEDGDLDVLVAAVPRLDEVLWVGSPGLAAALARRCARASGSAGTTARSGQTSTDRGRQHQPGIPTAAGRAAHPGGRPGCHGRRRSDARP